MSVIVTRLLVYSIAHVGLFWTIVGDVPWLRYPLVAILVGSVLMRLSSVNTEVLRLLLRQQKAFVIDWLPPLIIIPFCTAAAFERGMMVEAVITSVYWISTLRLYRHMSDWKKLRS